MADEPLTTPWDAAKSVRGRSRRQEERLAKLPGGKKQINSGRSWISKRDVRLGGFLVEARTTEKASYAINRDEFIEIERNAIGTPPGQLPAVQIDFTTPSRTLSLMVVRLDDHVYRSQRILALEGRVKELQEQLRGSHT